VALEYFGNSVEFIELLSFDEVAESVIDGFCELGLMAIENSIAGSIIPNYALIDSLGLNIVGEHFININHQLMALPGSSIDNLEVVASHPMALLQCKNFFKSFPKITLVEDKDTAGVAKRISEDKIINTGAIASVHASQLYGLEILSKNIQTIMNNETRFVIVSKNPLSDDLSLNKASIKFSLSHETGSLASVLNTLKDFDLNLTKIQSLPIIEIPWKYSFFIDITFKSVNDLNKSLDHIDKKADSIKVLGVYKNKMK
jgi:prephenate dehydratase